MKNLQNLQLSSVESTSPTAPSKPGNLGCLSIVIGGIAVILLVVSYATAYTAVHYSHMDIYWRTKYFFYENEDAIRWFANALLCLVPIAAVTGSVLGIIALVMKNQKKAFGIIGLMLNVLLLLLAVCIFVLLIQLGRTPL